MDLRGPTWGERRREERRREGGEGRRKRWMAPF